jgi:predicted DsbA family dithiol-disulfide isomerase
MYGLEINAGPFGIDSRPALIGAKYAEQQGGGDAYHKTVFRAYWQEAQSIDNVGVLSSIAESVGLSRGAFLAALKDDRYEDEVNIDIAQAYAYGLNGVPAMIFADKFLVSGAQPYDVLCQIVEKIQAGAVG